MVRPIAPPPRIQGDRFVLRCWSPEDAALLGSAFAASEDSLRTWIPWVLEGSTEPDLMVERLRTYRKHFLEGGDALYAIMDVDESQVLGGIGLYRRVGPSALEIGYWVRTDMSGQGIATNATASLVDAGLTLPGIERVEIHCDPRNEASVAIPRKLGFRLREIARRRLEQTGQEAQTMIWEVTAEMLSMAYSRL